MKIYTKQNVYEAALDRIRYLFDEFENVIVNCSGGKDSTVIFNLTLQVAREKNRLPLKVFFLDQEAEWQATIDYMKTVMYHPDVEPLWLQVPFREFNATSHTEHWLWAWDPKKKWLREKEPIAIKENHYGTDRFYEMLTAVSLVDYPDLKTAKIAGVRAEESPRRALGLTSYPCYKHITWGRVESKKLDHYTFYPIYDWSYTDIWKAIHDNGWAYNKVYDYMYSHGTPIHKMRVSNVHHETAISTLFYLQEFEPDTWNKLVDRLGGINTAKHLTSAMYVPKELPKAFNGWREYRDYLADNLLSDDIKAKFVKRFRLMDNRYKAMNNWGKDQMYRVQINSILLNDYEFTKMENWEYSPQVRGLRWPDKQPLSFFATNPYVRQT